MSQDKQFLSADEQDDSLIGKNKVGDWKSFLSLVQYAGVHKTEFIKALFLMLASSATVIISARFMGSLVDEGLLKSNFSKSWVYAGLILVLQLLSLLFMWWGRRVLSEAASLAILSIRARIFSHLQNLPLGYYDRQPQGRIVTRITHDVEGIEDFFTSSLGRLLNAMFTAIMAMGAMLATDLKLGGILVLSILPAVVFILTTRNIVRKANRKMSRLSSQLNAKLSEFVNGIDVIRAYGLEGWSKKEYGKAVDEHYQSQLSANFLFGWTRPLVSFLCSLPLIGLTWFGGQEVLTGALSVGVFVAFIRYCERFFMPIMMLAREIHVVQQAFTNSERVSAFLSQATEDKVLGSEGDVRERIKGEIKFEQIKMQYDEGGDWVLKNLNFEIKSGEKIGLVGTTGCGKTTTVSLLSRLYEYQEGDIFLDGISLRNYERSFLRGSIGFVSQDAIIFRGSLKDNLDLGEGFDNSRILGSCKKTGLFDIMERSGMNLDSEILEGGANLSAGERQLLSLTRVLLKDPSILILDEATANIDPGFEKIIHHAVDQVMEGRTCLIIAHRLDTLKSCDRIFVFEKGKLVEEGSESELFENRGYFYRLQQSSSEANPYRP